MSPFLKFGAIHPRTLLADLGPDDDAFRRQLAWREFYATVLHHLPSTARTCFQPLMERMRLRPRRRTPTPDSRCGRPVAPAIPSSMPGCASSWQKAGCTTALRMITASFLVKDLHIDWTRGARHFMDHLIDGDLASNQHGWQWTAGTGTDAAPYFRIFNPASQSRRFDPDGDYIRRWVPELAALPSDEIHEPWRRPEGPPQATPNPSSTITTSAPTPSPATTCCDQSATPASRPDDDCRRQAGTAATPASVGPRAAWTFQSVAVDAAGPPVR